MIYLQIRGIEEVQSKLNELSGTMQAKVIGPAINKVAEKARTEVARAIPEAYAVKAGEVRNSITLRKAGAGNLQATVQIFGSTRRIGRSMNLIHFLAAVQIAGKAMRTRGAKVNKKSLDALHDQIGFLIKRAGGIKKIAGAFIGNDGRTVFRRIAGTVMESRKRYAGTKHAEQIEPLQVIGFSQMFRSRKIIDRVLEKIKADLLVEVDRSLARAMAQK